MVIRIAPGTIGLFRDRVLCRVRTQTRFLVCPRSSIAWSKRSVVGPYRYVVLRGASTIPGNTIVVSLQTDKDTNTQPWSRTDEYPR